MARGGYRPGSGRPRSKAITQGKNVKRQAASKLAKSSSDMMPLDYMLAVMRDERADEARRDKMAQAAAPFVHERAADKRQGKKEQREAAAKQASNVYALNRAKINLVVDNNR